MPKLLSADEIAAYHDRGYHFPVDALSASEVADFRGKLEDYEASSGGPIKAEMRHRSHVLFTWIDEMTRHPKILDFSGDRVPRDSSLRVPDGGPFGCVRVRFHRRAWQASRRSRLEQRLDTAPASRPRKLAR